MVWGPLILGHFAYKEGYIVKYVWKMLHNIYALWWLIMFNSKLKLKCLAIQKPVSLQSGITLLNRLLLFSLLTTIWMTHYAHCCTCTESSQQPHETGITVSILQSRKGGPRRSSNWPNVIQVAIREVCLLNQICLIPKINLLTIKLPLFKITPINTL